MSENFGYSKLKTKPPTVNEGGFDFKREQVKVPTPLVDGSFDFKKISLEIPDAGTELLPMVIAWGTFYWGNGETWGRVVEMREVNADFTYDRPKMQTPEVEDGGLRFERIRTKTVNPEESEDFSYKRV